MDSFDKNVSKMFDKEQSDLLPRGYSWAENADAIYDKMSKQKGRRRKVFFWLFPLIMVLVVVGLVWHQKVKHIHVAAVHAVADDARAMASNGQNIAESHLSSTVEKAADLSAATQRHPVAMGKVIRQQKDQEEDFLDIQRTVQAKASIPPYGTTNSLLNAYKLTDRNTVGESGTSAGQPVGVVINQPRKAAVAPISLLPLRDVGLQRARFTGMQGDYADIPLLPVRESTLLLTHAVTLRGGTLLTAGSYSSVSPKSDYKSWLPGYHVGLAYTVEDESNRYLSIGYDQELAVQYFDFSDQDQVQVDQEGVVIKKVTNALTGRTTEITGDVTSSVQRSRLFQTYNTFRYHRLNLVTGGQLWGRGNISARAGIGLSYAVTLSSAGYSINLDQEVFEYGPAANVDIYRRSLWSAIGEIAIAYQLRQSVELQVYSRMNTSLSNIMLSNAESLTPLNAQIGAAVSYKF